MPIISINRAWSENPGIVSITATSPDTIGEVSAPGYITAQETNIEAANNGAFQWLQTDNVLINVGGTQDADGNTLGGVNYWFQISQDFTSLEPMGQSINDGLTALAGGGQTGATPLTPGFNTVSTVVTTGDSVILPANVAGQSVTVTNTSANSLNVFPAVGDTINALGVNASIAVAAAATTIFLGVSPTNWRTK